MMPDPSKQPAPVADWRKGRVFLKFFISFFYIPLLMQTLEEVFRFSVNRPFIFTTLNIAFPVGITVVLFLISARIYRNQLTPEKIMQIFQQEGREEEKLKAAIGVMMKALIRMAVGCFIAYAVLPGFLNYTSRWILIGGGFLHYRYLMSKFNEVWQKIEEITPLRQVDFRSLKKS